MRLLNSPGAMQRESLQARRDGKTIGLVPTMGFLHRGHLSLVKQCRDQCDLLVVSIFVNPAQFLPGEDIDDYPRDWDRDQELCVAAGVDVLFSPVARELYGDHHSTYVEETSISLGLCGASRPGHFRGVTTVVAKLFNMVQPDVAFFGQKDAQQAAVIRRMVADLNYPIRIVVGPTVREADGLAMSSRNSYLSASERRDALCLSRALDLAEQRYRDGTVDSSVVKEEMRELIESCGSSGIDYIEIVDGDSLVPVDRMSGDVLVAVAVRIGKTRLIDNRVMTRVVEEIL
jgi:pantoate--beta-alanine ligase